MPYKRENEPKTDGATEAHRHVERDERLPVADGPEITALPDDDADTEGHALKGRG